MTAPLVRPLRPDERAVWEPLWQGYLRFYGGSVAPEVCDTTWARLHDPSEPMHGLVAEADGAVIGLVHYIFHRSTWTVGPYCYLQDLFTAEAARGRGAGRALIEAVYEKAREAGASRVYWLTQEGNITARALYDTLADRSGFIQYRKIL
ncbi:GCN5-related N-acetyltransferase [Methylobacterium sp. 4-46]|uniref:GNAT family N-acetyltransferase n=1 Tax=unclassified Methylobacterium TaxID=2615210 RepID=UPI000152C58F|nr:MULTISPECIES: GNAT family N-acetyltransferase [Methylobacterium]ACA17135.1 GCN5-related N-acetyltransferase [Methylobacterium sp. 4-46]WFT82819.1 GNAT family N-acetyltransferase [Methylobacterium nodulans]